jgi:hypothetical protein
MAAPTVGDPRATGAAGRSATLLALLLAALLPACDAGAPLPLDPDAPAPAPGRAAWTRILRDTTIAGDVVVPAGERWLFGPNVRIAGNLRSDAGVIGMRPGSSLHFLGGDPEAYVGGGMAFEPRFARDVGLWIGHAAALDIRGTPKAGWNRTGEDPTWSASDEYWIAPTEPGHFTPRRWTPGEPVPRIDPRVPAAEVVNVTRDVLIEGPGHIHIHSHRPQRIEYVTLRGMGISNAASSGPVTGRYALHLHHGGDGTRGTVIRGVAAVESGGRVFVPHGSHGITMTDNVSVNSYAEALWWDVGDRSDDVTVDRLAVLGVHMPRAVSGRTSQHSAVVLGGGERLAIRNSAVSGARGSKISHGFDWPSGGDNHGPAVWEFNQGNVAHNSQGSGIRLWFNNGANHVIANAVTYRNGFAGIENGAYRNAQRYVNTRSIDDRIVQHATARAHSVDGGAARFERFVVVAREGAALEIGRMRLEAQMRTEFIDCSLEAGPGAPKVHVADVRAQNAFVALFRRCGILPDDVQFATPYPDAWAATSVIIEHEDGRRWEITLDMARHRTRVRSLP